MITLHVEGMMCQRNCGTTVQNALLAIPGVVQARVSFAVQRAWITGTTDADALIEAVEDVGFDARLVVDIRVEGMMCQRNCGSTVQNALRALPFALAAEASFVEKRAWVSFRDGVSYSERIAQAIDEIECVGFEAETIDYLDKYLEQLDLQKETVDESDPGDDHVVYRDNEIALQVSGMSCAVCTGRVESAILAAHPAVSKVSVVLATARAVVEWNDAPRDQVALDCLHAVQSAGYPCEEAGMNPQQLQAAQQEEINGWRNLCLTSLALTVPMFLIGQKYIDFGGSSIPSRNMWVLFFLSTMVQVVIGKRFYIAAWKGWSHGRVMGMDFLVVLGTTSAYIHSVVLLVIQLASRELTMHHPNFMTGGMLLTFVTFGKFLEAFAKGKTASALKSLMELQPVQASRVVLDSTDDIEDINISSLVIEDVSMEEIRVGDLLRVLPGSRIPSDGVLVACSAADTSPKDGNCAYVDESALSGEPFPVPKRIGDSVVGSTVNQLSVLVVKVTATGRDTALAKIVKLMEKAQQEKAPIQAYADRLACVFAPSVMVFSLVTFTLWMIFNSSVPMTDRFFMAFMSAISVVVVACPCALGLATPTAVMVGTGVGAQQGLLIKGGAVLESMHSIDTVIFDKTGTLTTGRAVLCKQIQFGPKDSKLMENRPQQVAAENFALWLAACTEVQSEHPIAKAIVNAAQSMWGGDVTFSHEGFSVTDFHVVPGKGVECRLSRVEYGNYQVRVGSRSWTSDHEKSLGSEEASQLRREGHIVVFVSILNLEAQGAEQETVGVLAVTDPVKDEAISCVAALQSFGIDVWLCTGDSHQTADAVAETVGIPIENVCSEVSPEGKADLVTRLQQAGSYNKRSVAVVGDGINDSVALARADVGIAIGAGTAIAVEAADVVLVRSSLHDVVVAVHLSHVVFRRIIANFIWALGYNVIALPFAAGVLYPFTEYRLPPELAGLMMAFSSVSVVTSSLLLKLYKRPVINERGKLNAWGVSGLRNSKRKRVVGVQYSVVNKHVSALELV